MKFDICVLTAANKSQADGFNIQLDWRENQGQLPDTRFYVIADPLGKRIGSGGSTFYVLDQLYQEYGDELFQKRVLILHSGGDSKRLPAYSSIGKIFTPLPTKKYHALFDIMLENYAELPCLQQGQVIVTSGDVLLNFEASFHFSESGITGVVYPEDPKEGKYFGVYVIDEPQITPVPVKKVIQKPDLKQLKNSNAIDFSNRIWIDTGILNLAPDAIRMLLKCSRLLKVFKQGQLDYNLYHEILYAIKKQKTIIDSNVLEEIPLYVTCLPYCGFYHIGRSEEMLQSFYTLTHAAVHYQFQNSIRSNAYTVPALKKAWVYNSVFSASVSVKPPCLIESCEINQKLILEGENIVTGLKDLSIPVELRKNNCLSLIPLKNDRWTAIMYGIKDQFKDEKTSTFLNIEMQKSLNVLEITDKELWESNEEKELWKAKLFPVCDSANDAIQIVCQLQYPPALSEWRKAERISLKDILLFSDLKKMLEMREAIEKRAQLLTLKEAMVNEKQLSLDRLLSFCTGTTDLETAVKQIKELYQTSSDLNFKAQLLYWQGRLEEKLNNTREAEKCFSTAFVNIRKAVGQGLRTSGLNMDIRLNIRTDEVVWTMLPARLDFAGGWTDTPPICFHNGGCVLNASVILNGQFPIQVIGKIKPNDYTIGINSIDLGQRVTVQSVDDLSNYTNPADWLSLPKATFFASGIIPTEYSSSLEDYLQKLGGGIDLTLFSALPAGSGLGTSSILGAGLIATLKRLVGQEISRDELYARTSNLEQLMTTGGGWQDQIGGVAGGVKLIKTLPGLNQSPTLSWTNLKLPNEQLGNRFLLYYTGYRRLAKNLLRHVVGRFLERQDQALETLSDLAALAQDMKDDLDHRRIDEFGLKIAQAWKLNKRLDKGQSTEKIEAILRKIEKFILGAKLLGAGGGGFLFIVAKDIESCKQVKKILTTNPPNERARFFDFDVDPQGMRVTVL